MTNNRFDAAALFEAAKDARRLAYAPYSNYRVGAALLCVGGEIYTGCNIENAAFSPTVCAERVAFFKAVADGKRSFSAIAVAGGRTDCEACTPCGVCRQVMAEFCNASDFFVVFMGQDERVETLPLKEFLPHGFGPDNI